MSDTSRRVLPEWSLDAWTTRAACKDVDTPHVFDVPDREQPGAFQVLQLQQAAEFCERCPVRAECFMTAKTHQQTGVWGGALFYGDGRRSMRIIDRAAGYWREYARLRELARTRRHIQAARVRARRAQRAQLEEQGA